MKELNMLALLLITMALTYYGMRRAEKGKVPKIRSMPPLDALEEAVSRAAEMNRPVFFHVGGIDLSMYTIPALSILGLVTELCIKKGAHLICATSYPIMQVAMEDAMLTSAIAAGQPEYNPDVRFYAGSSFSYDAAIQGFMFRERPATHLLMGETDCHLIIYTETATRIGAYQIGGTSGTWNLPMMFATCNYTLIGEEFVAAGAVVSKDAEPLGSLQGQDWSKLLFIALLLLGGLFYQLGIPTLNNFFGM